MRFGPSPKQGRLDVVGRLDNWRGDLVGRDAEPANHEAVERALFLVSCLRPPVSQIPPESEPEVAVEGI